MKDHFELKGRNLEKWRRMRARGRRFYVLAMGLGFWGGLMFLAMGVVYPLSTRGIDALTWKWLLLNAVMWALGGLVFGLATWHFNEKAFNKTVAQEGKASA